MPISVFIFVHSFLYEFYKTARAISRIINTLIRMTGSAQYKRMVHQSNGTADARDFHACTPVHLITLQHDLHSRGSGQKEPSALQ
ncbi:MAG: hypothetical protein LUC90_10925 [Lachnospiraceae bacterium]|nr:hypothetical protein [Lachnospiraceae bacterium]